MNKSEYNRKLSYVNNVCENKSYEYRNILEKNNIEVNSIWNDENANNSEYQERSDLISYDEHENDVRNLS